MIQAALFYAKIAVGGAALGFAASSLFEKYFSVNLPNELVAALTAVLLPLLVRL